MKMSLALLAIVISLFSLALQLRGQKPIPPLEKFMVPAQVSELERRMERADMSLIRDSIVMRNGIGVPFIREIAADHQHAIVRVLVSEKDLPKNYDERRKELLETAMLSSIDVGSEFDLDFPRSNSVVTVQFISLGTLDKTYAEYKGGELTFH
jgi:hypothetical protein